MALVLKDCPVRDLSLHLLPGSQPDLAVALCAVLFPAVVVVYIVYIDI